MAVVMGLLSVRTGVFRVNEISRVMAVCHEYVMCSMCDESVK